MAGPLRGRRSGDRVVDPVQEEYSQLAHVYDDRWKHYVRATIHETLKRLEVRPGLEILDVGCGTGALLSALERRHPKLMLAGVDPTMAMLEIARSRVSENVALEQSRAESLPFDGASFDVVLSCSMFHYVRRPLLALEEMKRVLKPGGRLVLTDWCDDYLACKICDLFLRWFNEAHHKTYGRAECQRLLAAAGFDRIDIEVYKIDWLWGMMTATAEKKTTAEKRS